MKHLKILLMLALVGLMAACSYNELPSDLPQPFAQESIGLDVETRAETYQGQSLDQDYFVTAEDLENYVKFRRNSSKRSNLTVKEVKSYGFDADQTLFYILNFDQGWEVVAADKRVQPSLAHGESGEFTMDCDNEPMKFWMNMLANGVLQTRLGNTERGSDTSATAEKNSSGEQENTDHTSFWNTISPQNNTTRGDGNINTPTPGPLLPGDTTLIITHKYYLPHLNEVITENQYYGPYIQTQWGQGNPWNECCPTISHGLLSGKAKVGCAAVAIGQTLYFLQDKYNMNMPAYEDMIWYMDFTKNPPRLVGNEEPVGGNVELWNDMATYYYERGGEGFSDGNTKYVAATLSKLGKDISMQYGMSHSFISDCNMVNICFESSGIDCANAGYSVDRVNYQLMNKALPVIIYALPNYYNPSSGHIWIIDGCYTYTQTFRHYYLLTTTPMETWALSAITKEEASGYEDTIYSGDGDTFHMNWGEGGDYDGWYAKSTDGWSPNSGNTFTPSQSEIIYGFSPTL